MTYNYIYIYIITHKIDIQRNIEGNLSFKALAYII